MKKKPKKKKPSKKPSKEIAMWIQKIRRARTDRKVIGSPSRTTTRIHKLSKMLGYPVIDAPNISSQE